MDKQEHRLVSVLKEVLDIPIFADEIAEDEEINMRKNGYHCFITETGNLSKASSEQNLIQDYFIYYFSENESEIDQQAIEIIEAINRVPGFNFSDARKDRLQTKSQDRFVDRIAFYYKRVIKLECHK